MEKVGNSPFTIGQARPQKIRPDPLEVAPCGLLPKQVPEAQQISFATATLTPIFW
jgi:hypothetical protein